MLLRRQLGAWKGWPGKASLAKRPRGQPPAPATVCPSSSPSAGLSASSLPLLPQEIKVLQEMQRLQVAASQYTLLRDAEFALWFQSMERLSDTKR